MSHKVNPKLFRIKGLNDWDSRGFYKNPGAFLEEDFIIRKILNKRLSNASIEKIEIERFADRINIIISSARPGLVIGRGGQDVENLKKIIEKEVLKKKAVDRYKSIKEKFSKKKVLIEDVKPVSLKKKEKEKREIRIEIREVKNSWTSAELVGQMIAQQIEKRMPFRRILKQSLGKMSANREVQGAKIEVSGRLNGSEIARREWLKVGRLPLQTLRSDIDYAKQTAYCTYGTIGIKVWIYKGEKFD